MNKTVLLFAVTVITATSTALAEVNVNLNVGVPVPRVVVSSPSVHFDVAPLFVAPSRLGFYVGVDTPYDIIYDSNQYYLYYGNSWHNSRHHNGPWVEMPFRNLPPAIRKHRVEQIRSYRDREHRVYRNDRNNYRGRQFRPDHERKEELKQEHRRDKEGIKNERRRDRVESKDERRHDREEIKDNRRRDKEEQKDERRDGRQHGGRD